MKFSVYRDGENIYVEILNLYYSKNRGGSITSTNSFKEKCFTNKIKLLEIISKAELKKPKKYSGKKELICIYLYFNTKEDGRKRITLQQLKNILSASECIKKLNYCKRSFIGNYFDKSEEYIIAPDELSYEIPIKILNSLYNSWDQYLSIFSIDILYMLRYANWIKG